MAKVSVEFAGLTIALVPDGKKSASVVLPDARAVGGPEHAAVLLIKDVSGLKGKPDFTVTGGSDGTVLTAEYAGWFLRGDVAFSGSFDKFAEPVLDKTMDVKKVADAKTLVPKNQRPATAQVLIDKGKLFSSGVPFLFDFLFKVGNDEGRVYGPGKEVRLTERMTWDLGDLKAPFKISFTSRDGTNTVLTVPEAEKEKDEADKPLILIISNLVGGSVKANPHFDAFYSFCADGKRTPRIQRYKKEKDDQIVIDDIPDNPDECRAGFFQE